MARRMALTLKPIGRQVMVITGASSGIGLTTARAAAAEGARVMLVARNEEALRDIVDGIRAGGGVADYAVADVGVLDEVRAAAAKTLALFGRIDSWIDNAGVAIYAKLLDTPQDEHERMFRTNYFGTVNGALTAVDHLRERGGALTAVDHLRERGGALITIGSIAADIPSPTMGAYAASKHAAKAYIESLRIELNAERAPISITLIKPSGIDTPIAEHAGNHVEGEAMIPPPVYDPAIVARAILDAAEHPRRDVTVGGAGRLQVLAASHFPGLLARFGGLMAPLLVDRARAKTRTDNLFASQADGHERSGVTSGRTISLYTAAGRHPALLAAVGIALVGGLLLRRGRSDPVARRR